MDNGAVSGTGRNSFRLMHQVLDLPLFQPQ